jgi:hypothetical protein
MVSLSYLSQLPERIAPKVEQLVRTELKAPAPIPYQVLPGESTGATPGSLFSEWAHAQIGMRYKTDALFHVQFALSWPRPYELRISILRKGMGALMGTCAFAIPMSKPVRGAVNLVQTGILGTPSFAGEPATAARLNNNRDLLLRTRRVTLPTSRIGRVKLSIPRYLQVQPTRTGSLLVIHKLAQTGILFGGHIDIKDVLDFAPMLEYYL